MHPWLESSAAVALLRAAPNRTQKIQKKTGGHFSSKFTECRAHDLRAGRSLTRTKPAARMSTRPGGAAMTGLMGNLRAAGVDRDTRRRGTALGASELRVENDAEASFGQPRFAETFHHQFRLRLPAPGDPLRYTNGGIELKQTRHRLTRLSIASEMGESGRETAVSCRIGGVLTLGFLRCNVKAI